MTLLRKAGDCLKAHRIAVQARKIEPIMVFQMTKSHKGQKTTLKGNAYCVIETPLKK